MAASQSDSLHPWKVLSEELLTDCPYLEFYQKHCQRSDGLQNNFFILKMLPSVVIIPLTTTGELVLVKQYRLGTETITLEFPAGRVEQGEVAANAALRELEEETGYVGKKIEFLDACYSNPAMQDNQIYFYFVDQCKLLKAPHWDEAEELQTILYKPEILFQEILEKKISLPLTSLSGLFLWQQRTGQKKRI